MSDKDKSKPSKSVMGNLSSTLPTRMARRRDGEPVSATGEAKPRPKAAAKTARKPTRATPKAVGKPAAKTAPKPKAAARTKATAGTKAPDFEIRQLGSAPSARGSMDASGGVRTRFSS